MRAVIIDAPDGSGNTAPPQDDPGWINVGTISGTSAVYLGGGWVLTANHVGVGSAEFDGIPYDPVPGSEVRLDTDESTPADLLVFAVDPHPPLPILPLATTLPQVGDPIVMIGNGRNRGDETSWDPNGEPPPGPFDGYEWGSGKQMRWGFNEVDGYPDFDPFGTVALFSLFDADTSPDEAHAASGDSGGAVFRHSGEYWELVGVMYAVGVFAGQPSQTALYGNRTYMADVSFYADQIEAVTALPEADASLLFGAGVVCLVAIARRRTR